MTVLVNIVIVLGSILFMEIFATLFHKHVMHGAGWGWHESHHVDTEGIFEKNDLYAVCFSFIAMLMFIIGSLYWSPLWYIALGFTLYGLLYGFVHDGFVHQRWPFFIKARGRYLKRLVQAHRLHHATHSKDGAVSFGFLYAEDVRILKAKMRDQTQTLSES